MRLPQVKYDHQGYFFHYIPVTEKHTGGPRQTQKKIGNNQG